MTEIAAEEILNLPEYIQQCSIIYLPEVGFRLAVISSEEEEERDLDGYEFQVRIDSQTGNCKGLTM